MAWGLELDDLWGPVQRKSLYDYNWIHLELQLSACRMHCGGPNVTSSCGWWWWHMYLQYTWGSSDFWYVFSCSWHTVLYSSWRKTAAWPNRWVTFLNLCMTVKSPKLHSFLRVQKVWKEATESGGKIDYLLNLLGTLWAKWAVLLMRKPSWKLEEHG